MCGAPEGAPRRLLRRAQLGSGREKTTVPPRRHSPSSGLVTFVVTSSWLLGWYVLWPLPFAAITKDRRLQAAALALLTYFVVMRWTIFI